MASDTADFIAIREEVIPLPPSDPEGYRHVLLLGTTGAGKTTLVRQLIGTNPKTERFPSTSTAKTTIHDTEIVLDEGPWRAVVTFAPSQEVRGALSECISAATLEASKGADDAAVLRRLLTHVDQRFRFNYVLGNGPDLDTGGFDFGGEEDEIRGPVDDTPSTKALRPLDISHTNEVLADITERLRVLAVRLRDQITRDLEPEESDDEHVIAEIVDDEMDRALRETEDFREIVNDLMTEIEARFDSIPSEELRRTDAGWPVSWIGEWLGATGRQQFLEEVSRFSSNQASLFGCLLTPLVNGIRVAGRFLPSWMASSPNPPKLVLFDGEGLGHTPTTSSSVSTRVSGHIRASDAVVLVDNASQPMLAAPMAVMRELVTTGNVSKLILAFTHFDNVEGPNLPNLKARANHVLASADNVLASLSGDFGPSSEQALRRRIKKACFFLAGLNEPLSGKTAEGRIAIPQLRGLMRAVDLVMERPEPVDALPVYDQLNLMRATQAASEVFHRDWRVRLGLAGGDKEHWTRIKALNRRFAEGWSDEYDNLRPVADLARELREKIHRFLQNPLRWEGKPSDEEAQVKWDELAGNISERILRLATRRIQTEPSGKWTDAYLERGNGSTFRRAKTIGDDIFSEGAPISATSVSPDVREFLRDVTDEVEGAFREIGAKFATD